LFIDIIFTLECNDSIVARENEVFDMAILLSVMCSPKVGGFTEKLLNEVLAGAKGIDGVQIDEIFLPDYQFHTCKACYSCIRNSNHVCVLNDEMGKSGEGTLFKKLSIANGLLIANPTYLWSANALCHLFFERCYPFIFSDRLNGMPFASVTSAYNTGMHRLADRDVIRWAFLIKLRHIGSLPVHSLHFEKSKTQLRELERKLAEETQRDEEEGRKPFSEEERYLFYMDKLWTALEPYLDNITYGTFQHKDALTQLGFAEGWFSNPEAMEDFEKSDALFEAILEHYKSGNLVEATKMLAEANVTWKRATGREYRYSQSKK